MTISCGQSTLEYTPEDLGKSFFPLSIGDYREYRIHQIQYELFGNHDTLEYFLKEHVADTFINQTGGITYTLNRYVRPEDSVPWEIDSVWTAIESLTNVVVHENNTPYVKMIFPVVDMKEWDGNAFNILEEELYRFENVFKPFVVNGEEYGSTVKVIQEYNPDSIVMTDIRNEIYAENVGLIYKESFILHYCTENECLGMKIIEGGRVYIQELIGYGKE